MGLAGLLLLGLWATTALAYLPPIKEHFLPEALLREVMELEGYLEDTAYPQLRSGDYQENPSVRDHEYLQHSSLWANPFISENNENNNIAGIQRPENKQDTLPAYCDPPNPCPNGYTAEEGCIEEFENTASFSREYQGRQDCMCDSEHMFDCAASGNNNEISESDFDRLVQQFHADEGHKVLVAKKYHMKKYLQTAQKPPKSKWSSPPMHVNEEAESWEVPQAPPLEKLANARTSTVTYLKQSVNPYLEGERLPVAAKKGIHIAH